MAAHPRFSLQSYLVIITTISIGATLVPDNHYNHSCTAVYPRSGNADCRGCRGRGLGFRDYRGPVYVCIGRIVRILLIVYNVQHIRW